MQNTFKIYFTLGSWLLSFVFSNAQNLVLNPSFEQISSCPTNEGQLQLAIGWINLQNTQLSSDLFSPCASYTNNCSIPSNLAGHQYAKQGVNYAGLAVEDI